MPPSAGSLAHVCQAQSQIDRQHRDQRFQISRAVSKDRVHGT